MPPRLAFPSTCACSNGASGVSKDDATPLRVDEIRGRGLGWTTLSPGGWLRIKDRFKDLIKNGSEWISSIELENHVMLHPAVLKASVIGSPREVAGTTGRMDR